MLRWNQTLTETFLKKFAKLPEFKGALSSKVLNPTFSKALADLGQTELEHRFGKQRWVSFTFSTAGPDIGIILPESLAKPAVQDMIETVRQKGQDRPHYRLIPSPPPWQQRSPQPQKSPGTR